MIVQPPAETGVAQQGMAEGVEQDAAHVALIDRADGPVARVQHRQQAQGGIPLEAIDRLTERTPQPDNRLVLRQGQADQAGRVRRDYGGMKHGQSLSRPMVNEPLEFHDNFVTSDCFH